MTNAMEDTCMATLPINFIHVTLFAVMVGAIEVG